VQAIDPQEEVVEHFSKRRLSSLPVVDFEGRLLGVIRSDTLALTAQEDVAADMQAMVGASRQERALSPVLFAVKKRLPWLEINLVTAFLAASVVGLFEDTIARFTALAVLLPVVAGQSGNTGAGAGRYDARAGDAGDPHRSVAAGHAQGGDGRPAEWSGRGAHHRRRRVRVEPVGGARAGHRRVHGAVHGGRGNRGVLVPTGLTMLGQDPAQSSSIVLTTVTDIAGFASFLGIATMLASLL
jgi:magnesium transporter